MFYQDLFNCLIAWAKTRRWRRMFSLAVLPMLIFWGTLVAVVCGAMLSRQELAGRYMSLVQADVEASMKELEGSNAPSSGSGSESSLGEETGNSDPTEPFSVDGSQGTSKRMLVPLRRIMQLGNFNERVVYLVGTSLARQGRTAMGARLIRDVAPLKGGGFPPAHAFMADYALASWKGNAAQAEVLLSDLQSAERGGIRMPVGQLTNYASLLNNSNRWQEALNMLREHTDEYPQLNLLIVQIEKQRGERGNETRTALASGRADFENKRKNGEATLRDVVQAVQLEMLDDQIDAALAVAQFGVELTHNTLQTFLKSDKYNNQGSDTAREDGSPLASTRQAYEQEVLEARRLYSNVLVAKHQAVSEQRKGDIARAKALGAAPPGIDLRYLDLACQVDSANPSVGEALAGVVMLGQTLTPEMKQTLQQSLVDGTASGVTHLILANRKLTEEDPASAVPELRLALRKIPNSPVVMNNLAFAIMKYDPENLPEALQLIERALKIPGGSLTDRASMLDTLAEIRLLQGDDLGAIEMFEEAIKHDGSKLNTRKRLAETYQRVGMKELAQGQLAKIKQLSQ